MSARTKKRHTSRRLTYKVVLELPGNVTKSAKISAEHVSKLETFLDKYAEVDSIPWEELAKDRIVRYGKAGIALRGARYREGVSQQELALRTGVSQNNISKMENGKRSIGAAVAKKLANALNIDYELLTDSI